MTDQPTDQPARPGDATRRMTCVRRLYVLQDESGLTWLAVEEAPEDGPAEGGSMSHRMPDASGAASPNLGLREDVEVEGDGPDRVVVLLPGEDGEPRRVSAYRVSAALLPVADGADGGAT